MTKLEELKAALEAATPGEWDYAITTDDPEAETIITADGYGLFVAPYFEPGQSAIDAEFIALAHNLMPDLLEAVELLKDAREAYLSYACDDGTETAEFIADMQGILAGDICSDLLEKLK